ncbi:MAG TPA: serine/threonine-protein kinase [Pirellulaceae bacterium]|nr:serine/threonine-protein kinase [Pirellulaceae bacterium]
MMTAKCVPHDVLRQILADQLEPSAAEKWECHLADCPLCQSQLEILAAPIEEWREAASHLSSCEINPLGHEHSHHAADIFGGADRAPRQELARREFRSDIAAHWRSILLPPSHPELLGQIGRYEVEKLIGQGGFGVVFKAHDTELNRPVAIKILAPHLATHGAARRRFAREAQAAAAINHPNVVPIHAVDADTEFPYLVMTYVPGHSLQEIVERDGPLDAKSVVRIGCQIAAGLDAAHRQGLVHRDIKPANILLENDLQRALITDFGLARAADDAALTRSGWLAGTPHYMSPEQAQGRDIDPRSDLFSLGSVLYYLATGREPFRAEQPLGVLQKIAQERLLPVRSLNSDIPLPLSQFIDRLMEKRPADRLASARDAGQWLEQYLAHLQRPQDYRQPRVQFSPRVLRAMMRGMGIAAALAFLFLGWFTWNGGFSTAAGNHLFQQTLPSGDVYLDHARTAWELENAEQEWAWNEIHLEIRDLEATIRQIEATEDEKWPDPYGDDFNWEFSIFELQLQLDAIQYQWEAMESWLYSSSWTQ